MRKIMIIAKREYQAAVRSRAFIIGLLSMPMMMFGSIIVQSVLKDHVDLTDKVFLVVDRTPGQAVIPMLKNAAEARNQTQIFDSKSNLQTAPKFVLENVGPSEGTEAAIAQQRFELSERVKAGKALGFLEIGPDVINPPKGSLPELDARGRPKTTAEDHVAVRYQTNASIVNDFPQWAELSINAAVIQKRAVAKGLKLFDIMDAFQPTPLVLKKLSTQDAATGKIREAKDEERGASILVPVGLSMMMLMMIMVSTSPLLQSVFEEKMARIAEVLLGSVTPFQLMMGKLLGTVGVSLTTGVVYLGGSYLAAQRYGFAESLGSSVIGWFVVFQILGVLMFGSLYIAIGAACNDMRETQTLVMPVMFLGMLPMFALMNLVERPNGPLAMGLSLFPFSAPIVSVIRMSVPPGMPLWQTLTSITIVLAATIGCVYVSGRILRVGLLMQGKPLNIRQLLSWVIRG
jgi:ABC-type Na+ efflux pump permease subunit